MGNRRYAILTTKSEIDTTKRNLEEFDLKVVKEEKMSAMYALVFGVWPTEEVVKNFPMLSVLLVEGTQDNYIKYCTNPVNDVGSYYCIGA